MRSERRNCGRVKAVLEVPFGDMIERYRGALVAVALDRTGRLDVAEEIAQDVIVKAWEHRDTLRDLGAVRAWLFRITINSCITWQRRDARFSLCPADATSGRAGTEPVLEEVLRREAIRAARKALAGLPSKSRVAFLMHVSGYSYAEIGGFLNLPRDAVRGRIARARERVRTALGTRLQVALPPKERNQDG